MTMSTHAHLDGTGAQLLETATLPVLFVGPTMFLLTVVILLLIGLVLARIIFGLAMRIILIAAAIILGLFLLRLLSPVLFG